MVSFAHPRVLSRIGHRTLPYAHLRMRRVGYPRHARTKGKAVFSSHNALTKTVLLDHYRRRGCDRRLAGKALEDGKSLEEGKSTFEYLCKIFVS